MASLTITADGHPVGRDPDFCEWLERQGINTKITYSVRIYFDRGVIQVIEYVVDGNGKIERDQYGPFYAEPRTVQIIDP